MLFSSMTIVRLDYAYNDMAGWERQHDLTGDTVLTGSARLVWLLP